MSDVYHAVLEDMQACEALYDARFARSILSFMGGVFFILGFYNMNWLAYGVAGLVFVVALAFQGWVIPQLAQKQQIARYSVGRAIERLAARANTNPGG